MLARDLISQNLSNCNSNNLMSKFQETPIKYVPSGFGRAKATLNLHLNLKHLEKNAKTGENFKVQSEANQNTKKKHMHSKGAVDHMNRNKSMDFNLDMPNMEYAEASVQLGETELKNQSSGQVIFY